MGRTIKLVQRLHLLCLEIEETNLSSVLFMTSSLVVDGISLKTTHNVIISEHSDA